MSNFQVSSQRNPCLVCGRTKDKDCRISEDEGLVLCHTERNGRKPGEEFNGFIYLGEITDGAGWGKWLLKSGEFKKERTPGQEFRYQFTDTEGNLLVEEVRIYQATGDKKTWMEPKGVDTAKLAPYRYIEAIQSLKDGADKCFICEGPPKADALWELGISAVAFANGFKANRDSHWFEGFEDRLIVAADRDKPGLEKAEKVLKAYPLAKLLKPCPESAYWEPEFIAHGGGFDIKDWIEQLKREGLDSEKIQAKLWAAVEAPQATQAPGETRQDVSDIASELESLRHGVSTPAPIAALLPGFADKLKNLAKCLNLPEGAYAVTLLPTAASLIHPKTRLEISLLTDFSVPPILWGGLVGDSSALKSPVNRAIVGPLNQLQAQAWDEFKINQDIYETELEQWESQKKDKKNITDPVPKPRPPILRRYAIQNATPEAIGKILSEQTQRGFLTAVDELATLVRGMNQYKSGGTGNERSLWLSAYDAGPWSQERKSGPDIYAPHSSISVTGTIQPTTLRRLMGRLSEVDGFWPRFMWCYLPGDRVPPPEDGPSFNLSGLLQDVYEHLEKQPEQTFKLDAHGKQLWRAWHEWIEDERAKQPIEAIRAIYRKSLEQAGRVALVAHCLNAAYGHVEPTEVISSEILQAAIAFTKWSIAQALYIYGQFGLTQSPETKKYLAIIGKFKGMTDVKPSQIQRAWSRVDVKQTHEIIDSLIQMGLATDNGLLGKDRRVNFLLSNSAENAEKLLKPLPGIDKKFSNTAENLLKAAEKIQPESELGQKNSAIQQKFNNVAESCKPHDVRDSAKNSAIQQSSMKNSENQPCDFSPGQPVEVKHPTLGWDNGYIYKGQNENGLAIVELLDYPGHPETYPMSKVRACREVSNG